MLKKHWTSSIFIGFSIKNHPVIGGYWGIPIYGNPHIEPSGYAIQLGRPSRCETRLGSWCSLHWRARSIARGKASLRFSGPWIEQFPKPSMITVLLWFNRDIEMLFNQIMEPYQGLLTKVDQHCHSNILNYTKSVLVRGCLQNSSADGWNIHHLLKHWWRCHGWFSRCRGIAHGSIALETAHDIRMSHVSQLTWEKNCYTAKLEL